MFIMVIVMLSLISINNANHINASVGNDSDLQSTPMSMNRQKGSPYLQTHYIFKYLTFSLLIVSIPVTILGNILVCIALYVSPLCRQQPAYIILRSLAVADMLVGVISIPIKAKIQWDNGLFDLPSTLCWLYMVEETTFSIASVTHLFAIAAERYIALQYPYRYKSIMSRKHTLIVIIFLWVFPLICSALSILKWESPATISIHHGQICAIDNREFFTLIYILCFIIPTVFMSYIYYFVYKTSVRHINEISKLDIMNSPISRDRERRNRHFRMARSITIVFVVYALCWIPTILFILILYYVKSDFWRANIYSDWFQSLYFIFVNVLPHLNSTLNPFIYVISNKEFKETIQRVMYFKQMKCARTNSTYLRSKMYMDGSSTTVSLYETEARPIVFKDGDILNHREDSNKQSQH